MMTRISDVPKAGRRTFLWLATGAAASLLAGCSPTINRHGYLAKPGALSQVHEGMSKAEVEGALGSPSTTASINLQGDSYYYISSVTADRSFLPAKEMSREVIAIRFSRAETVESVAEYTLEDGRIVNVLDRKTPVAGQEFRLLKEFFRTTSVGPSADSLLKKSY
jgi:outer membrane protein assembly factor BamE (lipoprotein component of BamABCDE complex)